MDICTFELVAADGRPLPAFSAGSHVDVQLPGGLTRPYSLCNDPTESHRYLIGVLRDPASRGGSRAMHDEVVEGQVLQISAPKNHFPLAHDARRHLLLAGGIGVTPILCMAERLANTGADFEMHYCTRSPERTAFRQRIAAAGFAPRVHFHFDDGDAGQKLDIAALLAAPAQRRAPVRVRAERLHGRGAETPRGPEAGPSRSCTTSSSTRRVDPSDADAALRGPAGELRQDRRGARGAGRWCRPWPDAGVDVPVSCEQGVCGTCLTRVIEGVPDHRDMYLTPEEQAANDQFMPCCSRARDAAAGARPMTPGCRYPFFI